MASHAAKQAPAKEAHKSTQFPEQDQAFLNGEGDAWFLRSESTAASLVQRESRDVPLYVLERYGIIPRTILDIGCSNGWQLGLLHKRYGSRCVGIEPSRAAIRSGRKLFPEIQFVLGTATSIPLPKRKVFDLVIANFVFHWISRPSLLQSVAQIDRRVDQGGYLLIADFLPDHPTRNVYHHLPTGQVYTYKMDYAALFIASNLYTAVARWAYDPHDWTCKPDIEPDDRAVCVLLRKSAGGLFVPGSRYAPDTST